MLKGRNKTVGIETVGDLKKALENYDDKAILECEMEQEIYIEEFYSCDTGELCYAEIGGMLTLYCNTCKSEQFHFPDAGFLVCMKCKQVVIK